MKKIYIVLSTGKEMFVGFAESLYEYLLVVHEKPIVPFHGHLDFVLVKNVYNPDVDDYVTYKAKGWNE